MSPHVTTGGFFLSFFPFNKEKRGVLLSFLNFFLLFFTFVIKKVKTSDHFIFEEKLSTVYKVTMIEYQLPRRIMK